LGEDDPNAFGVGSNEGVEEKDVEAKDEKGEFFSQDFPAQRDVIGSGRVVEDHFGKEDTGCDCDEPGEEKEENSREKAPLRSLDWQPEHAGTD